MSPLLTEGTAAGIATGIAARDAGQRIVSADSPLTRLNYFDGKFLRADDLQREQQYLRRLTQLGNQGLGAGVVYGLDASLNAQGRLSLGAGLAIDGAGRVLLLPNAATVDVTALLDAAARAVGKRVPNTTRPRLTAGAAFADCVDVDDDEGGTIVQGTGLYVICAAHAESLCGTEDVYGRLCEETCVTSTDRPYVVEGIVVRALPLTLRTPLATSKAVALDRTHLRSLVASAYFADERLTVASLISGAGLRAATWCAGAPAAATGCVPLGVLARAGAATVYFDAWTARRERIEAPARRYWAWHMAMRPWDVFLAHVLQFQCHLHDVLGATSDDGGAEDPCAPSGRVLDDASQYLREVDDSYARHVDALSRLSGVPDEIRTGAAAFDLRGGVAALTRLRERVDAAIRVIGGGSRDRVLIDGGIVELPSAGYLPVALGTTTANAQVRRLVGPGVDLRFCVVRPDFVPHALEEAQHMDRISLLAGLDDPTARPEVDVLVPNGEIVAEPGATRDGWDSQLRLSTTAAAALIAGAPNAGATRAATAGVTLHGAGRSERVGSDGGAFHFAGALEVDDPQRVVAVLEGAQRFTAASADDRLTMARAAAAEPPADVELGTFVKNPVLRDATVLRFATRAAALKASRIAPATPAPTPPNAPANTPESSAAGWLTLRADRDLFALRAGESAAVSVELTVEVDGAQRTAATRAIMRARWFGTYVATQAAVGAVGGRAIVGQATGTYGVQLVVNDTPSPETAGSFEADVSIVRGGTADAPTLRARFASTTARRLAYELDASWGGTPTELRATLRMGIDTGFVGRRLATLGTNAGAATPASVTLATARLTASDDALAEGSALHVLSTSALALLGDGLTRAGFQGAAFADAAGRTLFPPAAAPNGDLTVRPTLDWVLFHRRRTKQCAAVERPVPAPARRYQVYHYLARDIREVAEIDRIVRGGSGTTNATLRRVDVVEYAGGLATLQTPDDVVLRDWQRVRPGDTIVYGAIATTGSADAAALEDARLARFATAVAPISAIDPDEAQLVTVDEVAGGLAVPGTDGMMLFVTMARLTATTCHDVWRAPNDRRVLALADAGRIADLLALPGVRRIGGATFDAASTDPRPADAATLASIWGSAGGGAPSAARAFRNPATASGAGDDTTAAARAASIARALGGTANTQVQAIAAQGAWPNQVTCPAVTVLIASVVSTVRVVAFAQTGAVNTIATFGLAQQRVPIQQDVVTFDDDALRRDAIADGVFTQLARFVQPGNVGIETAAMALLVPNTPTPDDQRRLDALVDALKLTAPPVVVDAQLDRAPSVEQMRTPAQQALLDENGVPADAVLALILRVVRG